MSLTYGFQTPRDLLEKLKRDGAKLDSATDLEQQRDAVFNFVVTAYHLTDWIKEGPAKNAPTVQTDLDALRKDLSIQVCQDLCHASKHYILRRHKPKVSNTVPFDGRLGSFALGYSALGQEKPDLAILVGSTRYDIRDLRDKVLALYAAFFQRNSL